MRAILVPLALTTLMVGCTAQQPAGCDISGSEGLNRCIKLLLINSRGNVAEEADPLRLPNYKRGGLKAYNIVVRGISSYNVDHVSVSFPRGQQIAVRATISWPRIKGNLDAKLRGCKRIIWKVCATVRAKPIVTVGRTVGTLTTTLNVNVAPDGQRTVQAIGTNVSLDLASIRIYGHVRGVIGAVNLAMGDPAGKIAADLSKKWWKRNKSKIEGKARSALDKAIREDLTRNLGRLLNL